MKFCSNICRVGSAKRASWTSRTRRAGRGTKNDSSKCCVTAVEKCDGRGFKDKLPLFERTSFLSTDTRRPLSFFSHFPPHPRRSRTLCHPGSLKFDYAWAFLPELLVSNLSDLLVGVRVGHGRERRTSRLNRQTTWIPGSLSGSTDLSTFSPRPQWTMASGKNPKVFSTLGLFILDKFEYLDEQGQPTARETTEQVRTTLCPCI